MHELRSQVSDDASQDLARQFDWYEREAGTDVAEQYLSSFRVTVKMLARQPDAGTARHFRSPLLRGIRCFQLGSPFRVHLVFYRVEDDALVVFRVLHGMRDLPRRLVRPPGQED